MAWFRKEKTKAVESSASKVELWTVCPSCKAHVYSREWAENLKVCPRCKFHDRLTCYERLELLLDKGSMREFNKHIKPNDVLGFVDGKGSYADKIPATCKKTGLNESVVTVSGNIDGKRCVVAVMDFRFLGGSLASGTGEKILLAMEHAISHKRPFLMFSASGGARMHEGILSLMQMAKTCAGVAKLNKANLPYISIMTHPTTGGVSASYAMMGDINIAEPGALIGFAGRRVIEETIKQKLPRDFQTSEYLLEHGFLDHIVERKQMKAFLSSVLKFWRGK